MAIQTFRQVPCRPHGGAVWLCFARTISACLPSNQILPQTDHPSWWEGVAPHHRLYRLFKISIPRLYSTTTLQSAWLESQPTKTQHVNTFIKLGVSQEPGSVPHSISTGNEARGRAGGWGSTRLLGPQKSALSSSCNPVHLLIKHGPQRKSGTFLTLRLPTLSRCRILFANRLCRLASTGLQQMHPSCHLAQ